MSLTVSSNSRTLIIITNDGLLVVIFFDNYEKVAFSKKRSQYFQTRVRKPYPICEQFVAEKPYPFEAAHTHIAYVRE